MEAESHSNIQLADFAQVRADLLSRPLTAAEQARRLVNLRDAADINKHTWSRLLDGLPQELLDTVDSFQRDGQQGKLCNACLHATCHTFCKYR